MLGIKIKKIAYYKALYTKQRGTLSNTCEEGSAIAGSCGVKVGSYACCTCPLFWFNTRNFVFCRLPRKAKIAREKYAQCGSPAVRLAKACDGVRKVCMEIERFGLDGRRLPFLSKKNRKAELFDELRGLTAAVGDLLEDLGNISAGSCRIREEGEERDAPP